jgi:hypothetical protein
MFMILMIKELTLNSLCLIIVKRLPQLWVYLEQVFFDIEIPPYHIEENYFIQKKFKILIRYLKNREKIHLKGW